MSWLDRQQPNPPSPYLDPLEAAEALRVHRRTVYRWLRTGKVPGHKIGGVWRIWRSDLPEKKT